MAKTYYCCPKDEEQVLFVEDTSFMKLIVPEPPATCPKCKKSYYKWECTAVPEGYV